MAGTTIYILNSGPWTVPPDWNSSNNTITLIGGGGLGYVPLQNSQTSGGGGAGGNCTIVNNESLTPLGNVSVTIGNAVSGNDTKFGSHIASTGGNASGATGGSPGPYGTYLGGSGGGGGTAASDFGIGGGGGGGAAGPFGNGGNGATQVYVPPYVPDPLGGGAGAGGADGGAAGTQSTGTRLDPGPGGAGANGGGNGGFTGSSDNGGNGTEFDASHGSGGGGAGGPAEFGGLASAGNGGSYGGGGGGLGTTQNGSARFSSAGGGIIVIVYDALTVNPATVAELWFSSTPGFVDFTVQSNRRNFISAAGGAQNLGASGQNPFGITPPVFLSSNGTPSTFAANNGRGGAFTNLGTLLVNGATDPPPSSSTVVTSTPTSPGQGVLGDYLTGNLYAFNEATYTDNGTPRKWMRRWRAVPPDTFNAVKYSYLAIDMETGAGVPNGANPQVVLRWSDDGGHTWSNQRIYPVGPLGATSFTVKFNRLGMTRRFAGSDRIFELSSSDPFKVAIIDAEVDVE